MSTPQTDPTKIPLQQLQQQRNIMQQELQEMKTRHRSMMTASKRYLESLRTVEMVESAQDGQKMLVPMNDSIFVPGELTNTSHVTVEIGTGFFVKRTIPDAKEYLERKVKNVQLYIERVGVNILAQENNLSQIDEIFRARVQMVREQADAAEQQA
ncbi:Prefoldin subunit 5 [Hondaea fermentalgiana]|uniref:Prefoldin subunit 5 n=1 Tax=Hondaea fermentalgiana TaxID=2315210 RepID=A0A2R5GM82_9STRA|nr:Prefoldin subunit 5 [Hondaea fermentalgiana]|eukprot:GBG31990.1 Prefoldin subunit 5 [Hondaea fermentalgiana]